MAIVLTLTGAVSVIAQALMLRELAARLNGNELIYGISLTVWLLSGALGSYVGGKLLPRTKNSYGAFAVIELCVALMLPLEILFVRLSGALFNIPTGSIPDILSIALISIIAIFPVTSFLGALFVAGSRISGDIGRMYLIESLGSLFGGLVFTFFLLFTFSPFQISGLLGLAFSCSALYMYKHFIRTQRSSIVRNLVVLAFMLAVSLILIYPFGPKLEVLSNAVAFKGLHLTRTVDSVNGRISVIEDNGTYSYFENGDLLFSSASVADNEELVHLSFLEARRPRTVLLIGGGQGGAIDEIMKHGVRFLDYVEYDPAIARLAKPYAGTRVTDGRFFIKRTKETYDLIIVNLGDPLSASLNRFYTAEFFRECKEKLQPAGVLSVHVSGSKTFMGREQSILNSSILKTLKSVFPSVAVIPGNYFYYFASPSEGVLTRDPQELIRRWRSTRVDTQYFNERTIPYISSSPVLRDADLSLRSVTGAKINSDLEPVSYYYGILMWLSYFPYRLGSLLGSVTGVSLSDIMIGLLVVFIVAKLLQNLLKLSPVPLIMCLSGFSVMTFQLSVLYAFQSVYGSLYMWIGMLSALFMGGLAAGSYVSNDRLKGLTFWPVISVQLIVVTGFTLYLAQAQHSGAAAPLLFIPVFSVLEAAAAGSLFPVATRLMKEEGIEKKAGVLYAADLIGGAFAALLASVFVVPVLGIINACLLSVVISALALVFTFQSS